MAGVGLVSRVQQIVERRRAAATELSLPWAKSNGSKGSKGEQSGYYSAHSWNFPLIRGVVIYDNNLQSHSREFITLKGIVFLKQ